MSQHLKFLSALALLAFALAGAGCGPGESLTLGAEADDPSYREGQQLEKQGRPQEALSNYLRVIAHRGESAPESHLSAGVIYKQHIKDPIAAIYHFRKYLEQQPNSRQAPLVRQQIEAAKRDFGRILLLPNQPLDGSREVRLVGADQQDRLERLERENEQLRNENAVLRAGGLAGATSGLSGLNRAAMRDGLDARLLPPPSPAEESTSAITLASIQPRDPEPAANVAAQPLPPGTRAKPTAPAAAGGRRHTVAPKDSLYGIAKKYYGTATNAKVQALIEANRDVLPAGAGTPLKEGMALKIP
jgi:tetratricopeptide (TPR) repeat protein